MSAIERPIRVKAAIRAPSFQWESVNPVLLDGEWGYDTDEEQFKIGDGVTPWNDLPFLNIISPAFIALQDEIAIQINEIGENLALLRDYNYNLHFTSNTGTGTQMNNSSFFRVNPGVTPSGSFSGYPAAAPLQVPYRSKLKAVVLGFAQASYDWSGEPASNIRMELEFRDHWHNGSGIHSRVLLSFGSYTGSVTPFEFHNFDLSEDNGFSYISGNPILEPGQFIGVRFIKSSGSIRNINNIRDPVMKLIFEQALEES